MFLLVESRPGGLTARTVEEATVDRNEEPTQVSRDIILSAVTFDSAVGGKNQRKPSNKKVVRGTCFSMSREGKTVNTCFVKVGCRGFVRKYVQPLLSQCEREKTLMRTRSTS